MPTARMDKTNLMVAIACIALAILTMGAVSQAGRERAKRTLCMANLRQLTAAWINYARDNDGDLVGASPATLYSWVNLCSASWPCPREYPITSGMLFRYTGNVDIYHCPASPTMLRTYSIVASMNPSLTRPLTESRVVRSLYTLDNCDKRFVFIDEDMDSYRYPWGRFDTSFRWYDPVPIKHADGTVFSYADGHVRHHKWRDPRTIEFGASRQPYSDFQRDNPDIIDAQMGVWDHAYAAR